MVSNAVSQGFARKLAAEDVTVAEWGLTRGAITKLAERLVAKGLVERHGLRDVPVE
jgi:hypothetical protein